MRQHLLGEEPLHSQESGEQDESQKKARTYKPQRIDVLLEVRRYFVASLKNQLLVHAISIEPGTRNRQSVVRDIKKNPYK